MKTIISIIVAILLVLGASPAMAQTTGGTLWTTPAAESAGAQTNCAESNPCSLTHALSIVDEGGIIYLSGEGVYPPVKTGQRAEAESWSEKATVTPAPDDDVALSRVSTYVPNIIWDGFTLVPIPAELNHRNESTFYINPAAPGTVIQNSEFEGTGIFVRASNTVIHNNNISGMKPDGTPGVQIDGIQIGSAVTNVKVTRNVISGFPYLDPGSYHPDCLQYFDVHGLVIRYNHFSLCGNAGIINSGRVKNVLIEGNNIEGYVEIRNKDTIDQVVRYNTISGLRYADPDPSTPVTVWGEKTFARQGQVFHNNIVNYLSYCNINTMVNTLVYQWNVGLCSSPGSAIAAEPGDVTVPTPVDIPVKPHWGNEDYQGDPFVIGVAGWDAPTVDAPIEPEPTPIEPEEPAEPTPTETDTPSEPDVPVPTETQTPSLNEFYFNWLDATTSFEYRDGTWYMVTRTPGVHKDLP